MGFKHLFIVSLTTVMLGYYFHSPLPDAISDQWTLKLFIAGYRLSNLLTGIGTLVGYDTGLNITRKTFTSVFKWTSQPVSAEELVITDTVIDGVGIRIYQPNDITDGELLPVVLYFHGGGMVTFSVDTYENILRQISKDVRAVVIAPEYRLAPEHPFPAAVDDCLIVTNHVMNHASEYFGDVNRIALAGDSAGGNLASSVALQIGSRSSKDLDTRKPKLQVLLYPMLQALDFQTPSYVVMNDVTHEIISSPPIAGAWYMYCTGKLPTKVPGLLANNHTTKVMKQSKFARYVSMDLLDDSKVLKIRERRMSMKIDDDLASELENCITDPKFSPLMAEDFSVFPTTYVFTSEYDILRDDGLLFVSRLKEAGVKFYHTHKPGGWHGMVSYTKAPSGMEALHEITDFLIKYL